VKKGRAGRRDVTNCFAWVAARDNSGIRVHFTEELRQYDGGVMTVGIAVTPLHLIPPQQAQYATAGYCTDECTSKVSY